MKFFEKIIATILIIISVQTFAQTTPKKILGTFILENKGYNFEFNKEGESNFSLLINEIKEGEVGNEPIIFQDFNHSVFTAIFFTFMKEKLKVATVDSVLKDKSNEIFYKIKMRLEFIDDEPTTAYFILRKNYVNSFLISNSSPYYNGQLAQIIQRHNVKNIDVETEAGTIKNISIDLDEYDPQVLGGTSSRSFLEFKNYYPISMSGKFDSDKFANITLYCYDCAGIKGVTRSILLSDLVMLDISYENNKEDYSPVNSVFSLSPTNPIIELRKEKRSKILEVAAFSDFAGLDQENPNGLIQIEAKRKLNINTQYKYFFNKKKMEELASINLSVYDSIIISRENNNKIIKYTFLSKDSVQLLSTNSQTYGLQEYFYKGTEKNKEFVVKTNKLRTPYYNFFGSLEPKLLISKLDENNRFLKLDSLSSSKYRLDENQVSVDPLELFRYQLASFGLNLNVLKINFPQLKFSVNVLDFGYYWYKTSIQLFDDKEGSSTIPLNNQFFQFGSSLHFKPDSRWGANFGVNYIKQEIWNPSFSLNNDYGLLQSTFDAHLMTSDNAKLFFRFRWNYEYRNKGNNFTQFQLGYSVDLFSANSGASK